MMDDDNSLAHSNNGHLVSFADIGLPAAEIAKIVIKAIEYRKVTFQLEARLQEFREAYQKYGESEILEVSRYKFQSEMALVVIRSLIDSGNPAHAVEVFRDHVNATPKILENAANLILEYANNNKIS